MASYNIIDLIRTECASPEGHVSGVVLDRGGAYLVTDIYDFMDHGHSFFPAGPVRPAVEAADEAAAQAADPQVARMRCRHCGGPTLRLAAEPTPAADLDASTPRPTSLPTQVHSAQQQRELAAQRAQSLDTASTG
jgi:hypothetical protein